MNTVISRSNSDFLYLFPLTEESVIKHIACCTEFQVWLSVSLIKREAVEDHEYRNIPGVLIKGLDS